MSKPFVPHQYQADAISKALSWQRLGLFADPGLGKTATALEVFRRLRESLDVSRLLVIAPLRPCYSVWPNEVKAWDQFRDMRVHIAHGEGLRNIREVDADIIVTNPESLACIAELKDWKNCPEMIAVDELTKFKHHTTGRSKNLRKLFKRVRHGFPWRMGLTGTPAPNGLEDLFGQCLALDDGKRLGTEIGDFRTNFWFVPVPDVNGTGHVRWEASDRSRVMVADAVSDLALRINAKDHLKLPELHEVDVRVPLPDKARALYDELRRELVIEMATGTVAALAPGALTSKCRQVANGAVYLSEDGKILRTDHGAPVSKARTSEVVHEAKAEALADLIEEAGQQPMLVVYEHRPEIPLIQKHVKRVTGSVPPYLGGGVSGAEGAKIEAAWNAGRLPVLLVHPQSAAHGLNLQAGGNLIVWYSLIWDLELYLQLNGRLRRQGQTADTVIVYRLMAERTIDQRVARKLRRKEQDQDDFLALLQEEDD
ncbi:MAG: DEAD/DEAH box helicase [Myxococcales bacterium]|nr:DEAD/DEAH box helicase [Myxococcales bacterium]